MISSQKLQLTPIINNFNQINVGKPYPPLIFV